MFPAIPIVLGFFAYGTAKWPKAGPWNMGSAAYKLVAILTVLAMALIIYIAIQPPNDMVGYITLGFIVLSLVIWFALNSAVSRVLRLVTKWPSVRRKSPRLNGRSAKHVELPDII
jgi:hypothetical protein